jgi:hypothetical protein
MIVLVYDLLPPIYEQDLRACNYLSTTKWAWRSERGYDGLASFQSKTIEATLNYYCIIQYDGLDMESNSSKL